MTTYGFISDEIEIELDERTGEIIATRTIAAMEITVDDSDDDDRGRYIQNTRSVPQITEVDDNDHYSGAVVLASDSSPPDILVSDGR
jgi:hypothetical protein